MGPQFNVYSKLRKMEMSEVKLYEDGTPEEENVTSFYCNPEYPFHITGLDSTLFYKCTGKKIKFGASTHEEYAEFKNHLAIISGFKSAGELCQRGGPAFFIELVIFSNFEGTIGPVICKKLYHDFKDNYDVADMYFKGLENKEEHSKYWTHYQNWSKALFIARHTGAVMIT